MNKLIFWAVVALLECGAIHNYRDKKRRAMRKRCVVCGQIIAYTAKVCPYCHQAPGNDTNVYDDDGGVFGRAKQTKNYIKKSDTGRFYIWTILLIPILAFIVYNNIYG